MDQPQPSPSADPSAPADALQPPPAQAGPLPAKPGEIGFVHEHTEQHLRRSTGGTPRPSAGAGTDDTPAQAATTPPLSSPPAASVPRKRRRLLAIFRSCEWPLVRGCRLATLITITMLAVLVCGTIPAWIYIASRLRAQSTIASRVTPVVCVHLLFAFVLLVEMLSLDRVVFRLRAERYGSHLSADEADFLRHPIPFAPWNRPPLPTYATVLAQSGRGTGDVEDHLIAAPPPPAYGNTRGSTLLLAGRLRESLRLQRHRSDDAQRSGRPASWSVGGDELDDAERARRFDATLASLERRA